MSDPHAEILTGGPGEPVDQWEPATDLDGWKPDNDVDGSAAARSGAWHAVLRGIVAPESLALTGLFLAILPWLGMTVLGRLGAAVAVKEADGNTDWYAESGDKLATATGGFSVALALLAVLLGVLALWRADASRRATVAMAGAAVVIGVLGAAVQLLVLAAGPAPGYW